jgi:hypothetical protein
MPPASSDCMERATVRAPEYRDAGVQGPRLARAVFSRIAAR